MKNEKTGTTSIFVRVLSVFIACVLPLIIVQSSMYLWGTQAVREELLDSAGVNSIFLRDHFEDSIFAINNQMQYLLKARAVTDFFVYYDNYRDSDIYTQTKATLDLLSTALIANPLLSEIRLYYPRMGLGLSAGHSTGTIRYDEQAVNARIAASRASTSPMFEYDGEYLIASSSPLSLNPQENPPAYYIEMVLDSEQILSNLAAFNTDKKCYSLQYNHAADSYLFSDDKIADAHLLAQLNEAMGSAPGQKKASMLLPLSGGRYTLVASYSRKLNITYGQLISQMDLERIPNVFLKFMLGFFLVAAISLLILCLSIRRYVSRPTHMLLQAFDTTAEGQFDTRIRGHHYAREYQALFERFNSMNAQIQQLITTNYEHSINLQRAQLKQLQAQINPHFLYNSFFLLRHMVRSGDRSMCMEFLSCLANYFQYITDNGSDTATMAEEYGHARNYLTIQLMRFEDILEADLQPLPENLAQIEVLRLTFQPLFENVMTHSKWAEGTIRRVRLSIGQTQESIFITVEDNGEGVTDAQLAAINDRLRMDVPLSETSGLDNIHRRLRLHYGEMGGLSVKRSVLGGFSVTITIPYGGVQDE